MAATTSLSAKELYERTGLTPTETVIWNKDAWHKQALPQSPGVYVVSFEEISTISFLDPFESKERSFWKADQEIIYIGRAKNLSRRLRQFRRHKYGDPSPHHGGQAILLLDCPKIIQFAETNDYINMEDALIRAFQAHAGRMPFGNRVRAATGKKVIEAGGFGLEGG